MPTIDDVQRTAVDLRGLLTRHRIAIAAGSRLEAALSFANHVLGVRNGTQEIGTDDDRPQWREMVGIFDLGKRLLSAEQTSPKKFQALTPWLSLFASENGQLAQTAPTVRGDQHSDKIFELLVALSLLPVIDDLIPDEGLGNNPDLLFRFASRTWGIACKRLYSTRPTRFRNTVSKAISQIEVSAAERGLVFVNLVNVVNHDLFFGMTDDGSYIGVHDTSMMRLLETEEQRLSDELVGVTDADLAVEFDGKKAMPGIVHYIGTTCETGSSEAPVLKTVQHAWSRGEVNELLYHFQNGLNSTASEYRFG